MRTHRLSLRASRRLLALALLSVLALGGCAGWQFLENPRNVRVEGAAMARESADPSELAATDEVNPAAPVPQDAEPGSDTTDWTIAPVTVGASPDALLATTSVRASQHEGFDRLEIELTGEGTPGWDARYVLVAFDEGIGRRLELDGQHTLQLRIAGTSRPQELGLSEYARAPITGAGPALRHVMYRANLHGVSTVFIGVDGMAPPQFRVFLEQPEDAPARLVIEIEDPGATAELDSY